MSTAAEITADHATHTTHTPYCGRCRFQLLYDTKDAVQHWGVHLCTQADDSYQDLGDDYTAGLDWLRQHGFTETYASWEWEPRWHEGGIRNNGQPNRYSVRHTFRNPVTREYAWLTYHHEG